MTTEILNFEMNIYYVVIIAANISTKQLSRGHRGFDNGAGNLSQKPSKSPPVYTKVRNFTNWDLRRVVF